MDYRPCAVLLLAAGLGCTKHSGLVWGAQSGVGYCAHIRSSESFTFPLEQAMKYSGALIPPALGGLRNHMASAPFQLSLAPMLHGAEGGIAHRLSWELGRLSSRLAAAFTVTDFSSLGCSERWRAALQSSHTIVWGISHSSGSARSFYS